MSFKTFLQSLTAISARRRPTRRPASRLSLEALEDRLVLSFSQPVDFGAGLSPRALVSADFNGDGRLDLAAGNHDDNTVSVLLGNGDGTFQAARTSSAGTGPPQLVAADLNADGKADLVTVGIWNHADFLNVLLSNGDGTFQPPQPITLPALFPPGYTGSEPLGQGAISAAVGDLDGDGTLDLIAGGQAGWIDYIYYSHLDPPELQYHIYNYVNVLLGNGDGTFRFGDVKTSGYPRVHTGDFNNDGRLDVLANDGALLGNGNGTLQDVLRSDIYLGNVPNPIADFNGDGKLDVLSDDQHISPWLSLGNGDGTFQQGQYLDAGGVAYGSTAIGDVNADGKLDIVEAASVFSLSGPDPFIDGVTTLSALVLLGCGDGSFAPPVTTDFDTRSGTSVFTSPVLADFDGNGFPDLAVSEENTASYYDEVSIHRGVYVMLNDGNWTVPLPVPPAMTISDVTVTEGNAGMRAATFTVTLSKAWGQPVTVVYATANGSATAGSDYQAVSHTLTIPAGQTTGTITVQVNGDRSAEPNETFLVNLSSPTNATIADGQAVGTIVDDEPRISISDVTKSEGKRGKTTLFTFTVTLSAAYDQAVTMSYATANGTATASNNDYVAKTGTLTFAPGETTKTITIEVKGDSKREANEAFYLDLFGLSSNALFTKKRGLGTILNDD